MLGYPDSCDRIVVSVNPRLPLLTKHTFGVLHETFAKILVLLVGGEVSMDKSFSLFQGLCILLFKFADELAFEVPSLQCRAIQEPTEECHATVELAELFCVDCEVAHIEQAVLAQQAVELSVDCARLHLFEKLATLYKSASTAAFRGQDACGESDDEGAPYQRHVLAVVT